MREICLFLLLSFSSLSLAQWGPTTSTVDVSGIAMPQYNAGQERGIVNHVLTQYNQTGPSLSYDGGVTIQFQLRGYSNPGSALPDGNSCVCPVGHDCSWAGKSRLECYFGFTFVISSPDQSVRYYATRFSALSEQGQLRADQQARWNEQYVVQLSSKPSAIDVFAHHLGTVIRSSDGSMVSTEGTLTHVDTFVVPLQEALPVVNGVQNMQQQHQFTGKLLGTQLSLSYSIACSGNLIGPNCDLSCQSSNINTQVAACQSNATSFFHICKYTTNNQVTDCQPCPWGVREGTYCQDAHGGVLEPHTAWGYQHVNHTLRLLEEEGVVDPSYRTWTIILAIVAGVLLLLSLLLAFVLCRTARKAREDESAPGHNYRSAARQTEGGAQRPLLQASYHAEHNAQLPPQPLPRTQPGQPSQPNLDAKPTKSALRRPMIPPAHIGGSNSINDTLNSSFASDVPMRPSRSEVV